MATVTLAEAKLHLRASTYVDSPDPEDDLINIYIASADEWIKNYLDVTTLPNKSSIKSAALLIISDLYENREGASDKKLEENPAIKRLLFPYRKNLGI